MEIGESLLTKAAKCLIKYFPDVPSKRKFPPKMYPSQTIVRPHRPHSYAEILATCVNDWWITPRTFSIERKNTLMAYKFKLIP